MRPRRRGVRAAFSALACALALAAAPASAPASHTQATVFDPPGNQLVAASAERRDDMLDQIKATGSDTVRLLVNWRDYAPAAEDSQPPAGFDPSDPTDYPPGTFDHLDASVRGILDRGMYPLMTPSAPAPTWATAGGTMGLNRPDPVQFRHFVHALGVRYSGTCYCDTDAPLPYVGSWSVWNEPNLFLFIHPQIVHGRSVSGAIYRRLFLGAQRALEATGHGSDPLLIGETAPTPGSKSTPPLTFLRDVLCLNRRYRPVGDCAPIDADGWGQHPYLLGYDPWSVPTQRHWISIGSIGRLTRALKRAYAAGATTTRLPVWVTEFGVESYPEPAIRFGESPLRQAEYLGMSEYLLWRNPQIAAYGQYLLNDDPDASTYLSFQTGLRYADGEPKPAYSSFPMTLVARRIRGGEAVLWGHVRPGTGIRSVDLDYRDALEQVPHSLETVRTNQDGYFTLRVADVPGREYRATSTIDEDRTVQGPFIHSYSFPVG